MRLVAGDAIAIWFSPGIEVHGIVVRRDERTCGVRFEEIQNSRYLLRNSAKEGLESRARPPRFSTDLAAAFYFDGLKKFGRVVNISQWGMNVAHVQGLQRGVHVQVALANDRARRAVVRWTSSENAGLYLLDPFSVEELGSTEKLKTIW